MVQRKRRYRNARLKAGRDKTLLRGRLVTPATVPANKPDPQFLIFVAHHKVSTYLSGRLMHQCTQIQKVPENSRYKRILATGLTELERQFVTRRLAEEQSAIRKLTG